MNHGYSAAGLPSCISATTIPILQDDLDTTVYTTVGLSGGYAVVDGAGVLVGRLPGASLPTAKAEVEALVTAALGD